MTRGISGQSAGRVARTLTRRVGRALVASKMAAGKVVVTTIAATLCPALVWAQVAGPPNQPVVNDPGGGLRLFDVASSVGATVRLANDRQALMVTNNVLANMLKGYNEQINCSDCVTGFGSAGSFSAGAHGRKSLTPDLSVVGGVAFSEYRAGGVRVTGAPILAGLVRYDLTEWGTSRPFFEAGGVLSPGQRVTSTRNYGFGTGSAIGRGTTSVTGGSVFGRIGWVMRPTPQDEVAAGVELSRGWQHFGGYAESALPSNPLPLLTSGGTDSMNTVRGGAQWTHLWDARVETQLNLGVARSFGSRSGLNGTVPGGRNLIGEFTWGEYGARIGYRVQQNFVVDLFADGTFGGRPIGNTIHGGVATRYAF